MRILAAIYLTIVLVNFGLWLGNGVDLDLFPTPYAYLIWGLYCFSLLALLAFVLRIRLLPQRIWQLVFFVYVFTRGSELAATGLPLNGDNLVANLNILASYLWLVLPAGLAMWHLSFASYTTRTGLWHTATMRLTAREQEAGEARTHTPSTQQ